MDTRKHYFYAGALFAILALCMAIVLASAPLARADDTDASSTPDTTQSDTPPAPPSDDTSADASTTPQDTSDASSSDPSITTGDASSDSEVNNNINNNTTDSDAASTTVDDTNVASTTDDTSSDADTGGNAAIGGGSAEVSTGNAISSANVINVVNTNIVNSEGLLEFINAFSAGGYDLRNLDLSFFGSSPTEGTSCSLTSCGQDLTVNNSNTATVTNTVVSVASTGGNAASSTGDASVSTGDAAASANVVNVVNTNITDSHYLLVALNNFGDLAGNITLPSASFFDQLMSQNTGTASTTVSSDNTADLNSTTTADADTGDNTASGGGDASVSTGDALSNATSFNQVNTNQTGGSTVFLLVNVFGNWSGNIQGLPAGLNWIQTPNGVAITGGTSSLSSLTAPDESDASSSTDVSNTNDATVSNDVQVYALTGQNYAGSASGTADIATGNAYASANVVNLVNTNVLGQNWILAILNVFGNWTGDLDFGQPDLWIGAEAQTGNPTTPGSQVVYTFTVANHGDADATNVVLDASFDPTMLSFDSGTSTDDGAEWDLGTIPASTTEQFSYTATAGTPPDGDVVAVPLSATVTEDEDDANTSDNTDQVTIAVGDAFSGPMEGFGGPGPYMDDPKLTITKTESVSTTTLPASVDYQVVIDNPDSAGPAYNATLEDTITDSAGNSVYDNSWDLDTINPGDEITLTYTVDFDASSTPGMYVNTATVTGEENYPELPSANAMNPVSASTTLQIIGGEVLGASTSTPATCAPLLTSYLMTGVHNNMDQVIRLQSFLDTFEGGTLGKTGIYDVPTIAAVEAFQEKYASDILSPWGMSKPSGNVYYTTEKEINEEYCQGTSQFPLTASQLDEIQSFRTNAHGPYGIAAPHTQVASKPKQEEEPAVVEASSTEPTPKSPDDADSILNHFFSRVVSILGVPLAHAQTK